MTESNCLVSVILPIYNMEKYLENCVNSIISQTYKNIEIILVDDGSSDNSLKICNSLAERDSRITVISKQNGGVSTARNAGLDVAQGDWVMFVDPDDYLSSTIIQRLLYSVTSLTDIVACCCKVFNDHELNDEDHFFTGNITFTEDKNDLYFQLMNSGYSQQGNVYTAIGVPWGKLYKRSFLEQYKLRFNTDLRRVQDNIFNMYAFFYSKEIKYVDEALYNYRYEHMSDYFKKYRSNYADIFVKVRESRYECLVSTGLISEQDIFNAYKRETIINLVGIIKNGVFHKENKAQSYDEKINSALRICEKDCFNVIFSGENFAPLKYKAYLWLIKHKFYRIISLLSIL